MAHEDALPLPPFRRPGGTLPISASVMIGLVTTACLYEIYPIPLSAKLPTVYIPLRADDVDMPLDLQALIEHWRDAYDWRVCEAKLNALGQYVATIDGLDIHFLHVRSPHPNAMPLIMTHGWPGSVVEFHKVIEPLTDPTGYMHIHKPDAYGSQPTSR
jgi:hypothetical protein